MIKNEYIQYVVYFTIAFFIYRIIANGIELSNLNSIKTELINQ